VILELPDDATEKEGAAAGYRSWDRGTVEGSKDMHGIPPTTESLSPNSVNETFVWILNEKEPKVLWTSSGPGTC
jgi:hypothetical protein